MPNPTHAQNAAAVARGTVAQNWAQRHGYAAAYIPSLQGLAPTAFAIAASSVVGSLVTPVEDASVVEADHAGATPEVPESAHFAIVRGDGREALVSLFAGGSAVLTDGDDATTTGAVLDVLYALVLWLAAAEVAEAPGA